MYERIEIDFEGKQIKAEIKKIAKQSDGSALVQVGDTVIAAMVCYNKIPREEADFLPLIVDYRENTYAAGKFPGGFFKREGRPTEHEILKSRLIDRSLRPLFPKAYYHDTQVICYVYSADPNCDPDIVALNAAALSLYFSPIPFDVPLAAVRIGLVDGNFLINPGYEDLNNSDLNLVMVGTHEGIVTVEARGREVPEETVVAALKLGFEKIKFLSLEYLKYFENAPVKKIEVPSLKVSDEVYADVKNRISDRLRQALFTSGKLASRDAQHALYMEILDEIPEDQQEKRKETSLAIQKIKDEMVRDIIVQEGIRADGRGHKEVRNIECQVNLLPRTHGSALFTRGETQALVTITLGTAEDAQIIDVLEGESSKRFMLHYNFPPFSVNEVSPLRGTSRREIGHGALAERALLPLIPVEEKFPYTIRVVSDILESNGSSSMATVCGGSLALMDAGVPIHTAVAGIAMGLITKDDKYVILTDIAGDEDHSGDMDFKVAGTEKGITSFQMDIKIKGLTIDIMAEAMQQANEARMKVLEMMNKTIEKSRDSISPFAPKLVIKQIPIEKIAALIGPGGKMVKSIIERTGVKIDIQDNGKVTVASNEEESIRKACEIIDQIAFEAERGKTYTGKVTRIENYGAFVEISPGTVGLMHISEFANHRIRDLRDEIKEGDILTVKVIGLEDNKIRLSHKEFHTPKDQNRSNDRPRQRQPDKERY
ncbi:MAG: polyribonucleotide nucleotidyltransferase [Candidatus Fischerbacteria bacterium RBG_13_37_8]|uniref:Polyribonucleotide nucleotidyltransferase n=1 Tax=Candidatus Fischerbacteria bacterium RBG_13_37_8 TaxID=1817863 RepID=A0A1F5V6C2_9BACT|nr:MAG: polyribonucleotide nucleotidyltransferase [Candidatus Fischerbacteria bacterium RBG_13_37_8]